MSDVGIDLLIEQYAGEVESQFAKSSIMREFTPVRSIRGTDTIVNNRVGRTVLEAITPGVRPNANPTTFGRVTVTVDTVILARDNRSMLNELQTHFDARMELAQDHGKELGKFFDTAFIIQAIKGSFLPAPTGSGGNSFNGAFGAGKNTQLAAVGNELDPDLVEAAIEDIIVAMQLEDIGTEDLVILVNPTIFRVLRNNDKLISTRYSEGNGKFAEGTLYQLAGCRLVMTNRIPTVIGNGKGGNHPLSNAENGNAYDVTANELNTIAVILHPKSLFAGETIPLTSDIWFNREEKQWFIDSFLAFGVTTNRPDVCGTVLKANGSPSVSSPFTDPDV
ncbi:MAG TPA: hypothetical protein VNZ45_16805 [Bacteroidia bacterium]|nr:hypothetical protein [Bacteroidia bacterium]